MLGVIKLFIIKALLAGRAVVLNDLGRFQVSLQSKCFTKELLDDKEFVPSSMIKGHRILFRPQAAQKKEIASKLSLNRIASEVKE